MSVVITGVGVVAPTGIGAENHWERSLSGRSALGPVTRFDASALPVDVVGEVADFDEADFVADRLRVQTDRWTWMALAATRMALGDADLDPSDHDPYDLAVVTSSSSGGNEFGQREIHHLWESGPGAVSAYQSIGWFYAASSGQISIREQLKGACGVVVADAAGGIDALASAVRGIRRGTRAAVVGGTEAALSPYALACQVVGGGLSDDPDPATAFAPFSPEARGPVPGEGGAMLVVEDADFVRERGGPEPYAEVLGTAATHDAADASGRVGDHTQLARVMTLALGRAGVAPDDVSVVFADGWGDPDHDAAELAALREVFAGRRVPVTVPKTMTGRLNSGGAVLDLASAALALRHDVIPPTANAEPWAAGLDVDLVTSARHEAGLTSALVVARGFGGFNSAAVLGRVDEADLPPQTPQG